MVATEELAAEDDRNRFTHDPAAHVRANRELRIAGPGRRPIALSDGAGLDHVEFDEAVHLDGVLHRQLSDDRFDEAGNDQ